MKVLNHVLEVSTTARHRWSHFRVHKHETYRHIVWGKLSIIVGQPHLEEIRICSHCDEEISVLACGNEGLDVCENCSAVEGPTEYITREEYDRRHS